MSNAILVSVVMPVYNAARYLPEALDAILAQDLTDIEIICVDDGSTDDSPRILSRYADADARIRVISQHNAGAGAARNRGIDEARGEFLCFTDADDLLSTTRYLSRLYRGAKESGTLAAGADFLLYRGKGKVDLTEPEPQYAGYRLPREGVIAYRDYQYDYGFHRFLFHRSLFDEGRNRFPRLSFFEDPVFLVRILSEAGSFYAAPDVAYWYRSDYKPLRWTTGKTLDLIEGVRQNLLFSRENDYAKLHWYTACHFDEAAYSIGIGLDDAVDVDAVEPVLRDVEQLIDADLLNRVAAERADGSPLPGSLMRRDIEAAKHRTKAAAAAARTAFRAKRALTPLYRTLRG